MSYDHNDFSSFGAALEAAHDVWARHQTRPRTPEAIRDETLTLLRSGESMIDVPQLLSTPLAVVLSAMTFGELTAEWFWQEHEWLAAEAVIYDGIEALLTHCEHGIHVPDITAIVRWYHRPTEGAT